MALAKDDGTSGAPVSEGDVIKYLVQSEPLSLVTEISSYVDLCSSELRQRRITRESQNSLIEAEKRMATSVDQQVLDEVNGLCTIAKRLLKGADDVVSTRSRDLREIASLLHGDPPLTTPPVASLGVNPLAQMANRVEELIVTQESVRNKLEIDKDNVTAALCEISNRGESLKSFLDPLLERMRDLPLVPLGGDNRRVEFESLCDRYRRRTQYLLATIEKVIKNSETIRNLVLSLEKNRGFELSTPLRARAVTLAEELSGWHMRWAGAVTLSQLGLISVVVQIVNFGCRYLDRISFFIRPRLLGAAPLLISFIVLNAIVRSRFHAGGLGHTAVTSQITPSKSIRDLLLEGRTSISDELIHNLVPRRT